MARSQRLYFKLYLFTSSRTFLLQVVSFFCKSYLSNSSRTFFMLTTALRTLVTGGTCWYLVVTKPPIFHVRALARESSAGTQGGTEWDIREILSAGDTQWEKADSDVTFVLFLLLLTVPPRTGNHGVENGYRLPRVRGWPGEKGVERGLLDGNRMA